MLQYTFVDQSTPIVLKQYTNCETTAHLQYTPVDQSTVDHTGVHKKNPDYMRVHNSRQ